MNQPQKRNALVKFYTTDANKEALGSIAADMGCSVSNVLDKCTIVIVRNHQDAKPIRKDIPAYPSGTRPKLEIRRAQLLPSRTNFGIVPRAKYLV
jgi:hypothetical protein